VDFVLGPVASGGLGPEFSVTRLFDVEVVVAVSRDHPRASARSLATLAPEEWIVTGPASGPGAVVEQLFRKHRLTPPRCVIYLETIFSAVEMIKHTHLAGLLPAPVAAAAGDSIRAVPIRERCEPLSLCMVIPTRTMLTPAARALVSAVRATSASWCQANRGQTRRSV
jgi:LysR family transcriptional regulator, regulator of abg operon